jgi:predicted phosphodiesterase
MYRPKIHPQNPADRRAWKILIKAGKEHGPSALIPTQTTLLQQWLVLPDVHRPFHNKILWAKILRVISDMGTALHGIVLSGDYLDLFTLSSHNAGSMGALTGMTLKDEYLDGLLGIDELEQASHKGLVKKFLYGNHEDRYFRHVNEKDNAKYGGALLNPVEALRLDEKGWETKTNWKDDFFRLGTHLDIIHGIYTSVHAAKVHLDKTEHSVMFGHTHRFQTHYSGDKGAFNIGGLYDKNSKGFKYMPRFQREVWANGFAKVSIDDNGQYYAEPIKITNDCFVVNGKVY